MFFLRKRSADAIDKANYRLQAKKERVRIRQRKLQSELDRRAKER
jgi:hypothetical protein